MGRELWVGNVDFTMWADRDTLDSAEQAAAQGVVETSNVRLRNYQPIAGLLPTVPKGHADVLLINRWGVGLEDYDTLASGVLQKVDYGDGDMRGNKGIVFATPIKPLKTKLHSVVFYPQDTYENTDVQRIRKLGTLVNPSTGWNFDFSTYVLDPGNITYPDPIYPNPHDGTSGDAYTEYQEASIEEIIRSIATDPGWFSDTNYPVQARNWWIEGRFVNGDPDQGVVWYLHYQNVPTPGTWIELMDAPDDTVAPPKALYYSGAQIDEDYSQIIRQISIAGERKDPFHITWHESAWPFKCNSGLGFIFKKGGEDGVWDAGARSQFPIQSGEWEVMCQAQELYLEHDTFQRDDQPSLSVTNQGNLWKDYDGDRKIKLLNQLAVPTYDNGIHLSYLECYASTCIIRAHLARNREGMRLVFRYLDYYNYWFVQRQGAGYGLHKMEGGADSLMATFGGNTADMAEIKVFLKNNDALNEIHVFIDDEFQYLLDDPFLWDTTKHGLSFHCDIVGAFGGAFYDFQVTTFYADRAFGMGDADGSAAKPLTSWIHISFGFVFNSDGTLVIAHSADSVPASEWLDTTQGSYDYNDRFKVLTVEFINNTTGVKERKVQWFKQPGGQGPWILLYEVQSPLTAPGPTEAIPWYAQFVAKELGAALANLMIGRTYSNVFVASGAYLEPLVGTARWYPANGLLQSDQLDNYQKRQKVADAIFRADANPRVSVRLRSHQQVKRGEFARITSRRAGWEAFPTDTRKVLMCTSCKRIEGGTAQNQVPLYEMVFGSHVYSAADPGRTYLLRPGEDIKRPTNKEKPFFNGMALQWNSHVISGLEDYGRQLEVVVVPQDVIDWQNQVWPSFFFNSDYGTPTLPASYFPANGKYMIYHRTVSSSGVTSEWSPGTPFVSPPQTASDRTSTLGLYMGDGTTTLVTTLPGALSQEMMVNQNYHLLSWALALGGVVGDVVVDIEYCTAVDRRDIGETAWQSICGVGQKPFVSNGGGGSPITNDGTYNDSANTFQWSERATNLRMGDFIRARVVQADNTAATTASLTLAFLPIAVPFTQQSATENGQVMAQQTLVDTDGEPLVDSDNEPLVGM